MSSLAVSSNIQTQIVVTYNALQGYSDEQHHEIINQSINLEKQTSKK